MQVNDTCPYNINVIRVFLQCLPQPRPTTKIYLIGFLGEFHVIVRPVLDDTQTTQVSMRLALYQIRDMVGDIFTSRIPVLL